MNRTPIATIARAAAAMGYRLVANRNGGFDLRPVPKGGKPCL